MKIMQNKVVQATVVSAAIFSIVGWVAGSLVYGSMEPTVETAEFKQHHFNVESEEVVCETSYFNRMEIIGNKENGDPILGPVSYRRISPLLSANWVSSNFDVPPSADKWDGFAIPVEAVVDGVKYGVVATAVNLDGIVSMNLDANLNETPVSKEVYAAAAQATCVVVF